MLKSLQQAKSNISSAVKNIWIFSDNQAVIKRIHKNSNSSGQEISYKLQQEAESLLSTNIQLHVCWVPGHMNIYGNEQADRAAKLAAAAEFSSSSSNVIDCSNEVNISFTYLRKSVKKSLLQSWQSYYHNSEQKGTHYLNLQTQPVWKPVNLQVKTNRIVWSSYMQLKLGHGHFKSYVKRVSDLESDKCDCNNQSSQTPTHLLLSCNNYQAARLKLREKLQMQNCNLSLKILLATKHGISMLIEFLKETRMARRENSVS